MIYVFIKFHHSYHSQKSILVMVDDCFDEIFVVFATTSYTIFSDYIYGGESEFTLQTSPPLFSSAPRGTMTFQAP